MRSSAFKCLLVVSFAAGSLWAQGSTNPAPSAARDLVVKVNSWFDDGRELEVGSGVIVGADRDRIYIVTARHVIRRGQEAAVSYVSMAKFPDDSVLAVASDSSRRGIDIAVLVIPRTSSKADLPRFDRLGVPRRLKFGDLVSPMGCPQGECWGVPVPADHVVGLDRQGIFFQSGFVKGGSSGGALFNLHWEIVGIVTEDQPPRANAVSIDQALDLVRVWGYPVQLRRAKVPRAGYSYHVGATFLTRVGGSEDQDGAEARFPSGRVVASRRGDNYGLIWHIAGMRLAPRNLLVSAGMGGVGVDFKYGRLTAQTFIEAGLGQVEGRFRSGVYYVDRGNGSEEVPIWTQEKQDGLGLGVGLSVQALVAPHVTLELLGGHWSFNIPEGLTAELPPLFAGGGFRWGF
jgi:hypothetical protein